VTNRFPNSDMMWICRGGPWVVVGVQKHKGLENRPARRHRRAFRREAHETVLR
jgi:hypothetical protein